MDDSFRVRVDKIFGALGPASTSPSPSLRSLWSLSDAEVEKREWNRPERDSPDREDVPCSSSFNGFFDNKHSKKNSRKNDFEDNDLDNLDDEDDDELQKQGPGSSSQSFNGDEHEKEEFEIRSSIGLDPTLDNEEEEDEYDKVAVGRENAGERTFMKDVTDYGPYLNSHNVLPNSFKDHTSDSRADRLSAINRLKEDIAVAGSFVSHLAGDTMQAVVDPVVKVNQDVGNLKPILKRKESQSDSKSQKRVRFDPGCKDSCEQDSENPISAMVTCLPEITTVAEEASLAPQYTSGVPDYVRNPSKYTRYTFDSSSEVDEQCNRQAYMDFLNTIRRSNTTQAETGGPVDPPKSITFIPKKKASDGASVKNVSQMNQNEEDTSKESIRRAGVPLSIAAEETIENEACAMEEDEQQTTTTDTIGSSRKPGRQYRSKISYEDTVS